MKRLVGAALLLLGCDGYVPPDTVCEVATNDGTAVRCFNTHGICYVGLEAPDDCQCNGDDEAAIGVLRELSLRYYDLAVKGGAR